jgi:hypothetical protein
MLQMAIQLKKVSQSNSRDKGMDFRNARKGEEMGVRERSSWEVKAQRHSFSHTAYCTIYT